MLTKDDLEQIGKIVKGEIDPLKKDLQNVQQSLAQTPTAVEALAAGQQEIRENMATKADIHDLGAEVVKKVKSQESRIEDLEKDADIPHPHKN